MVSENRHTKLTGKQFFTFSAVCTTLMLKMRFKNIFSGGIFLMLGLLASPASAQDTCILLFTLPQQAHFATGDHLNNTYLLQGFELEKYDSTGKIVARYSNNRLGMASFLDASNPLKILVWYPGFQTAVFLDRNLTELGRLNLAQAGYPAVRCLASAADGNVWVYDEAQSFLLKLSTAGEKLLESPPLNLEFSQRFVPTCIRDDGGQAVYLSDPEKGIAAFGPFAQLDKIQLIKVLHQFDVENGILTFNDPQHIQILPWRGISTQKIPLPESAKQPGALVWLSKKRLFVQDKSGLQVYAF